MGTADGGHASKKVKLQHKGGKQPKAIVLDIEGTVAPISFVTETLFPYARARVTEHLTLSFDSEETQADLDLLRQQVMPFLLPYIESPAIREVTDRFLHPVSDCCTEMLPSLCSFQGVML